MRGTHAGTWFIRTWHRLFVSDMLSHMTCVVRKWHNITYESILSRVCTPQTTPQTTRMTSHVIESWPVWTRHVTYKRIMSHMNGLCHTCVHRKHSSPPSLQHTAAHCNTLQHTATHCNALQHFATHCNAHAYPATTHHPTCPWLSARAHSLLTHRPLSRARTHTHVCVHTYIYIYTYIYVFIYMYIHIYV